MRRRRLTTCLNTRVHMFCLIWNLSIFTAKSRSFLGWFPIEIKAKLGYLICYFYLIFYKVEFYYKISYFWLKIDRKSTIFRNWRTFWNSKSLHPPTQKWLCFMLYNKSGIVTARSGVVTNLSQTVPEYGMNIDLDVVKYSEVDFSLALHIDRKIMQKSNILKHLWRLQNTLLERFS